MGAFSLVSLARSHRASFHPSWVTDVWKRQHEMLQLQERLDAAMWAKRGKSHGLGEPVTEITKQGVRLTPPKLRLILKTLIFREGGVSCVLTASGAHKFGALRTVRPHVFAHTLWFSARGFLTLTQNAWFLEVPSI